MSDLVTQALPEFLSGFSTVTEWGLFLAVVGMCWLYLGERRDRKDAEAKVEASERRADALQDRYSQLVQDQLQKVQDRDAMREQVADRQQTMEQMFRMFMQRTRRGDMADEEP